MASEAQLKSEIARLTATISKHKATSEPPDRRRPNTYVNPNYKPSGTYVRPTAPTPASAKSPASSSQQVKEVVLNGIAFQSSSRSLVRKDLPKPPSSSKPLSSSNRPPPSFSRKSGHLVPSHRAYKPTPARGRRLTPANRNMTLTNNRRPYQSRKAAKRLKYSDKSCPRFSTTGSCSRGLTCMYRHDPDKIAICWNFLQDNCSKTAETCDLSHDPTPQRTPLCLHFLNKGRCTRVRCPFPHVNVGTRNGVCRDFAVLGYCEKGLDCENQHVRECPDFAEKGTCTTKGCKLPHVIRANRTRKLAPSTLESMPTVIAEATPYVTVDSPEATPAAGQLGDEYISLTFNESEEESEEDDDDDDNEEDNDSHDSDEEDAQSVSD